ncbi:hypothetical protein LTR37_005320 [Vermiconidia calcicola]|uniref:Uncharacterized protein n=1 Tax=Vermiconidia calcicola TaxID=1690605 RepID=A0ACC3NK18_9PEZI|nr:hypothetical protein LTR37_005320 [Vermiconidia calcicola]
MTGSAYYNSSQMWHHSSEQGTYVALHMSIRCIVEAVLMSTLFSPRPLLKDLTTMLGLTFPIVAGAALLSAVSAHPLRSPFWDSISITLPTNVLSAHSQVNRTVEMQNWLEDVWAPGAPPFAEKNCTEYGNALITPAGCFDSDHPANITCPPLPPRDLLNMTLPELAELVKNSNITYVNERPDLGDYYKLFVEASFMNGTLTPFWADNMHFSAILNAGFLAMWGPANKYAAEKTLSKRAEPDNQEGFVGSGILELTKEWVKDHLCTNETALDDTTIQKYSNALRLPVVCLDSVVGPEIPDCPSLPHERKNWTLSELAEHVKDVDVYRAFGDMEPCLYDLYKEHVGDGVTNGTLTLSTVKDLHLDAVVDSFFSALHGEESKICLDVVSSNEVGHQPEFFELTFAQAPNKTICVATD